MGADVGAQEWLIPGLAQLGAPQARWARAGLGFPEGSSGGIASG